MSFDVAMSFFSLQWLALIVDLSVVRWSRWRKVDSNDEEEEEEEEER